MPDPSTDRDGAVEIQFIGHSTVRLDLGGTRVLTDPFLRAGLGPLERHGSPPDPAALGGIDLIVISHGHPDHFDRASLAAVPGRPVVVVPRGLGSIARAATGGEVVEVTEGDRIRVGRVAVDVVPAHHWISPGAARARPVGYVVDAGVRVYFAGDTGRFDAMDDLRGSVDVALVPVWTWGPHLGPGHLGPRAAAEVVGRIEPAVAVPIHWGTLYPRRLHHLWSDPLTEPGPRFAAHLAALDPRVDVRVLRPGETIDVAAVTVTRRPPGPEPEWSMAPGQPTSPGRATVPGRPTMPDRPA